MKHEVDVIVGQSVVRIQVKGTPEGSDSLCPIKGAVRASGVVEPTLTNPVPRVGIIRVASNQPTIQLASPWLVITQQ
jgi:hypothetical protein